MTEDSAEAVLDHYGVQIPEGVGEAACHAGRGASMPVAQLRHSDGMRLGQAYLAFVDVRDGDGVVVRVSDDDGVIDTHYAMESGVVQSCIAQLVTTTDYVVTEGDDEYLPPMVTDDGESEEDTCGLDVKVPPQNRKVTSTSNSDVDWTSTSDTTSDQYKATD